MRVFNEHKSVCCKGGNRDFIIANRYGPHGVTDKKETLYYLFYSDLSKKGC